jgi:pilus assembly protein Flp/PilA
MLSNAFVMAMNYLVALTKREEGQGMVEYGLLLGLIAAGVIAILLILGPEIAEMFSEVAVEIVD